MSISDWVGIVVGLITLYLLWQQNQIFREQNRIFATQAEVATMPSENSTVIRLRRYWPMLLMALLMLLTWLAVGFDYYDRHRITYSAPGHVIRGAVFENDVVEIDDKDFRGPCSFTNVTFVYRGGPWNMENCAVKGKITLRTDNKIVHSTMVLMEGLKLLSPEFSGGVYEPDRGRGK